MSEHVDYNTLSREELVKVATDLRDELNMLRRGVRSDMRRFCEYVVPDFTPLGGNRPDCAVASGVALSLSGLASNKGTVRTWAENPLPPDVFACSAGILCAPVIITGSLHSEEARQLCERRGPARTLSVRLRCKSEEEMHRLGSLPWDDKKNDYHAVFIRIELPPEVVTLPDRAFDNASMVKSIDLRSTRLTALGEYCINSPQLSQVHLPSTLTSIGEGFLMGTDGTGCSLTEVHLPPSVTRIESGFLAYCRSITSIDLRHLKGLTSLSGFMSSCDSLTEVHLPPAVTHIDGGYLCRCPSLVSVDLRDITGLKTLGMSFLAHCESLTEVHLPPSVTQINDYFLSECPSLVSIDLRHLTTLTSIGPGSVSLCNSLTEVHLPPSVSDIRFDFLQNCPSIVSIDLRHLSGLTRLGARFMHTCDSLTEVHLPDSVTQLPWFFLENCKLNPVCHWVGSCRRGEKRER